MLVTVVLWCGVIVGALIDDAIRQRAIDTLPLLGIAALMLAFQIAMER